jgi:oligopeptide/dipeptide ABC transporter ATP-binding protein
MEKLSNYLLKVEGLTVQFPVKGRTPIKPVEDVTFDIKASEIFGLVGESGSGKTVLATSLLRLTPEPGSIAEGKIIWDGKDLLSLNSRAMQKIRGSEIAMIFQNAQAALNPVYTVGNQMIDVIKLHRGMSKADALVEAIRLLRLVKIPDAEKRINEYPHQFSMGTCQRIMIAMALSCKPKLLIADEPTASLDVTIQAEIMDLLLELREQFNMAILLVSHDLGVIARMCDHIAVMYLGKIVENSEAKELFRSPNHPYTQALLDSVPVPDPERKSKSERLEADIPSHLSIPSGCRFHTRCIKAFAECSQVEPELKPINSNEHLSACLLNDQPAKS